MGIDIKFQITNVRNKVSKGGNKMAKVKKAKAPLMDLDSVVSKDKISVIKDVAKDTELLKLKSGGNKKLPSMTARIIGNELFKTLGEGRWINTEAFNEDQKAGLVRTFKKELMRWARHEGHSNLRVRSKVLPDKFAVYYEQRKSKGGKVKESSGDEEEDNGKKKNGKKKK